MIKTVAEFLEQLANAEAEKLAEHRIKHTVTIGAMYEGLTKDILNRALPRSLDLKIVDGFVHDGLGNDSGQIDCMLVIGEGEAIPFVNGSYRWHVKDVIAVFEVKKSLFGSELNDAFEQMRSVSKRWSSYVQNTFDENPINLKPTLRTYSQVTGLIAPDFDKWRNMPTDQHLILHCIMHDQLAPARIIFGYGGYKSEESLRKGFLDFLGNKTQMLGYGVPSIPSLITANGNSLIKLSGHPFSTPLDSTGYWPILGSTNTNIIELILEIIWTKITYIQSMPELFGEDLELETFNLLLSAKPQKEQGGKERWGWMYKSIKAHQRELDKSDRFVPWEPIELTPNQNVVIIQLCRGEKIQITDSEFIEFIKNNGEVIEDFVKGLLATTLVAKNGNTLEMTTFECVTMILPDGRYVAGENNTGRLSRWVKHFMDKYGS